MFYQQNPVLATILILVFIGVFLLFKLRKGKDSSNGYSFFSGLQNNQKKSSDNIINLLMLQQLFNQQSLHSNKNQQFSELQFNEYQTYIKKIREEVLELLRN
ncbi:MAG: hypothetical protein EU532_04790 [Promethearchaeota archaeon]|nr:MAG: hypothetical protein EU532_04790 [Candidatus Lokiarchaeota archaeon]